MTLGAAIAARDGAVVALGEVHAGERPGGLLDDSRRQCGCRLRGTPDRTSRPAAFAAAVKRQQTLDGCQRRLRVKKPEHRHQLRSNIAGRKIKSAAGT